MAFFNYIRTGAFYAALPIPNESLRKISSASPVYTDLPVGITWVPAADIDSIKQHGLLSSEAALENEDVLNRIATRRGVTPEELRTTITERLASWHSPAFRGVNALFALPPDTISLPDHHPSKALNAVPVKIKLKELLRDIPDTVVHGQELVPYSDEEDKRLGKAYADIRHRDLDKDTLRELLKTPPEELWRHFDETSDMYSADVPHMSIRTPSGIIDPSYIEV